MDKKWASIIYSYMHWTQSKLFCLVTLIYIKKHPKSLYYGKQLNFERSL